MPKRIQRPGTILVIVVILLIFAATALAAFLDRASNDLLVASHLKVSNRLREDAYSALETTLGVLEDFYHADGNALHSPGEGWGDPLGFAGWTPAAGHKVEVSFADESGKLPLIHTDQTTMVALFESWGLSQDDAQHLTDVLRVWVHPDALPVVAPTADYETDPGVPYDRPLRSLRTYDELAAIDYARDVLYDASGRPNEMWWRFYNDFSLFNYTTPNINGASPEVLAALGQWTGPQLQNIADFLAGKGDFVTPNPLGVQWFSSTTDVRRVTGGLGAPGKFGTAISALRILVTVHEGGSVYRVSAVVAPQGGARTVTTTATAAHLSASNAQNGENQPTNPLQAGGPGNTASTQQTAAANAGTVNLRFPFTILEIRENEQILTPPELPPLPSLSTT